MLHEDPKLELAERRRFLGIIVGEAERLTRLINQILDMAKMESGHAEWTSSEADVGEVVREAIESLASFPRKRRSSLTAKLRPIFRGCWRIGIA